MMDFVKVRAAAPTVRARSTALKGLSEGAALTMNSKGLRGGARSSPKGPSEKAAPPVKELSEGAACALRGPSEGVGLAPKGPSEETALPLTEASGGVMFVAHHSRTSAIDAVAAKTHEPPIQLSSIGLH